MDRGDFAGARESLRAITASNPEDADAQALYGVCAHMCADPVDGRAALTRAVRLDPNHLIGQKFLAAVCNALGDRAQMETAASKALQLAPLDPQVLNLCGTASMQRFEMEAAANFFNTAVQSAPGDVMALLNLELLSERTLRDRRTFERSPMIAAARAQAIDRLRAAERSNDLDDRGLNDLLTLLTGARDTFPEAVELAHKLAAREDLSWGLANQLAKIFQITGDLANLLRFDEIVVAKIPQDPLARLSLAQAQLIAGYGHWQECWAAMRKAERHGPFPNFAAEVESWTGQALGAQKLLVYQEQGLGDAIMALRLVPMLAQRGVRFDLWVNPVLAGLASTVKGYENLICSPARPDARTLGCAYASTLFGLISAMHLEPGELSGNPTVLQASSQKAPAARARLRALKGRRIGLCYGGNPSRRDDWFRSIPVSSLEALAQVEAVSWVNLGIDDRPERREVAQMLRMDDPMGEVKDFEDTAAIVSELDAVVAIDSSVAHLSCSLGKPVWVLAPSMLDWRWQIGGDAHPWWPNATVLRSPAPGDWDGVIRDLAKRVEAWQGG